MPSFTNVTCADEYTEEATLAYVYGSPGGYVIVESEPVFYSLAYGARGFEEWTDDYPGQVGNISIGKSVIGVRVRNQVAGQNATASAVLAYPDQPVPAPAASGQAQVTPTNTIQVQEDGTVIGTEAALDFVNSGNVGLSVTDDSGNGRIQVAASVALKHGEVASNGTIVSGVGFTVNHSSTGIYVVSWNPAGIGNVIVIPAVGNSGAAPSTLGTIIQVSAESNTGFTVKTDSGSGLADEPWQFLAFPA